MNEWLLVGGIRFRQARAAWFYWLRLLGVGDQQQDMWQSLYAAYIAIVVVGWVVLSWSAVVSVAHSVGGPLDPEWTGRIVLMIAIAGAIGAGVQAVRVPFRLTHGDLEWLAPSPISRRIFAVIALIGKQVLHLLMATFIGSVLAAAIHAPSYLAVGFLFGWYWLALESLGWQIATWRMTARRRAYPSGFWTAVAVVLVLGGLFVVLPQAIEWPAHLVVLGLTRGLWTRAFWGITSWLAVGWILVFLAGSRINVMNIQKASLLYADIQALGTRYAPNPGLIRELREKASLSRHRARGHLPSVRSRLWETGRWAWGAIRLPSQILMLVELSLMFRSGLLLAFSTKLSLIWLLWLVVAYRFRRGSLNRWFRADLSEPFARQFWSDPWPRRLLAASAPPWIAVTLLAGLEWLALPLGNGVTLGHALFLVGLAVAWSLGEAAMVVRQLDRDGQSDDGHVGAVIAGGLMVILGAGLHHPGTAMLVPVALLLWYFYRWSSDHEANR